jgi:hypothetical protein
LALRFPDSITGCDSGGTSWSFRGVCGANSDIDRTTLPGSEQWFVQPGAASKDSCGDELKCDFRQGHFGPARRQHLQTSASVDASAWATGAAENSKGMSISRQAVSLWPTMRVALMLRLMLRVAKAFTFWIWNR